MFFANYFLLAHEAFESFLESVGFDLAEIFRNNEYLLPIAHAESDYKSSLVIGDALEIQLTIEQVRESSFAVVSRFIKVDKSCAARIKILHVAVSAKTKRKIPLPKAFRNKMSEDSNQKG